jgi:hypothetical protein
MSEPLHDLRTKVSTRTRCFLEAESRATGKDVSELVRVILNDWSAMRLHVHIEAHKLLASEGEPGIAGGIAGSVRE